MSAEELQPVPGQLYGTQFSCGVCDCEGGYWCRPREEPTHWWMGLDRTGQAHYLCDDCRDRLYCVRPVMEKDL